MEKKLYKSDTDKKVCGICGGLADYLDIDSSIIRCIMAIIVFSSPYGILIYLLMAMLIPIDNRDIKVLSNRKKLYKSQKNKIFAGVCGGVSEYLNINSMLIRFALLFSILWFGSGLFIYIVMAIVMPIEDLN